MEKLVKTVVDTLDKKLGEDITVIDFENHNPVTDYFVIVTARNSRHAMSLVDDLIEAAAKEGFDFKSYDAEKDAGWMLVDFYDVVVHIFLKEDRELYDLERLWKDQNISKL